jgi:hypothetical protein
MSFKISEQYELKITLCANRETLLDGFVEAGGYHDSEDSAGEILSAMHEAVEDALGHSGEIAHERNFQFWHGGPGQNGLYTIRLYTRALEPHRDDVEGESHAECSEFGEWRSLPAKYEPKWLVLLCDALASKILNAADAARARISAADDEYTAKCKTEDATEAAG